MYGYTPLHMACSWPQPEVVRKLIDLDANLDARNNELKTPLALACDEGNTKVTMRRALTLDERPLDLIWAVQSPV